MKNLAHNKYHILRLLVGLSILLVLVVGLPSQSLAQSVPEAVDSACLEVWQVVINVAEDGEGIQDLVFGQGIYATNAKDVCDQLAPPPPPSAPGVPVCGGAPRSDGRRGCRAPRWWG